jgi:hypothetical protein
MEGRAKFSLVLMKIADNNEVEGHVRMASALLLKNMIKREWPVSADLYWGISRFLERG